MDEMYLECEGCKELMAGPDWSVDACDACLKLAHVWCLKDCPRQSQGPDQGCKNRFCDECGEGRSCTSATRSALGCLVPPRRHLGGAQTFYRKTREQGRSNARGAGEGSSTAPIAARGLWKL